MELFAIRSAIDRRDADRLKADAHTLKGAAANLSATQVADAARALEQIGAGKNLDTAEAAWHELSGAAQRALLALQESA